MNNNTIHTTGFRVRKYGTKAEVESNFSNVFEDTVFEAETFEFD